MMMDDYYDFDDEYADFGDNMEYDYGPPPMLTRYDRYNNAFGNYRGGYGPGGDYGPPRFGPRFAPPGPGPVMGQGYGPRGPGHGYGPRGPPGPLFGPRGPPNLLPKMEIDKAYRYLIRCGVPKESLKNVPNEFYGLVQPQHCGLCGMDLPDFNLSRVHYSSKNHMKSQRKWLSKRVDAPHRAKEMPMKARELYCELCDVQITSKSHAEAHYLGKPHRSIVEGRKMPKNPMLLQRNMNARLEQLIRREKRALKNADEKKPVEEEKKVEDIKIDPELYCDICKVNNACEETRRLCLKLTNPHWARVVDEGPIILIQGRLEPLGGDVYDLTSVTCSEQMTMHLNGKKHLTKEKRHIFDMMKGKDGEGEDTFYDDGNGDQQQNEASGGGDADGTDADGTDANNGTDAKEEEAWTEEWNENK